MTLSPNPDPGQNSTPFSQMELGDFTLHLRERINDFYTYWISQKDVDVYPELLTLPQWIEEFLNFIEPGRNSTDI